VFAVQKKEKKSPRNVYLGRAFANFRCIDHGVRCFSSGCVWQPKRRTGAAGTLSNARGGGGGGVVFTGV